MSANNFSINQLAKALIAAAKSETEADELLSELDSMVEVLNKRIEIKNYLADPEVKFSNKEKALDIVFEKSIGEKNKNFLRLLIQSDNILNLGPIYEVAKAERLAGSNISLAVIESVVPLDKNQANQLKKALFERTKKEIRLNNVISTELIGGLRITIDDMIIDSSVAGKLDRLRNNIREIN
ncbi:MAG TPA: ATP synthase F1 subunit delta [Candidatus Bipolaricaulota bacterium]|nr:ATP synthase F1 subunit delta [Candidatus Bipolaricaulota bacterium]